MTTRTRKATAPANAPTKSARARKAAAPTQDLEAALAESLASAPAPAASPEGVCPACGRKLVSTSGSDAARKAWETRRRVAAEKAAAEATEAAEAAKAAAAPKPTRARARKSA